MFQNGSSRVPGNVRDASPLAEDCADPFFQQMAGVSSGGPSIPDMMAQPSDTENTADVDMIDDLGGMGLVPTNDPQSYSQLPMQSAAQTSPIATSNTTPPGRANSASGPGASALSTGFGIQSGSSSGSTLTEFTKRRNWSKLVLEELRDLFLILSPDARMQWASPSCKLLTGYEPFSLVGKFIRDFIHQDDRGMFSREFNESIASGNQLRFFYRFRKEDGSHLILEAFGHPHLSMEVLNFGINGGGTRNCRGLFMISRPYPTKNAALLDSFLEHKIENERLTKKIEELKREEREEEAAQDQYWVRKDGHSSITPSESQRTSQRAETEIGAGSGVLSYDGMPPPPKPSISNTALTKQNLNEALAASRPDSINDKMARYEGATQFETIEMLTGLRHREGERSEGISTGAASPALIRGDVGIAILTDRDNRANSDRKKKLKVADEYVCTDCGTLDSPEWRKGPSGPKTLCNACGCKCLFSLVSMDLLTISVVVRWAKKEKRRQGPDSAGNHPSNLSQETSNS
jgi:PAS domain S-box-containing protein